MDDVRLAVQARTEGASVPKELLLQLASQVNSMPLPAVPEVYGVRLPPPAQRLTAPNFSLVKPDLSKKQDKQTNGNLQQQDGNEDGLFGQEGEEEEEDDDEDEDDEEMEDVTLGLPAQTDASAASNKRKAGTDDEEYD